MFHISHNVFYFVYEGPRHDSYEILGEEVLNGRIWKESLDKIKLRWTWNKTNAHLTSKCLCPFIFHNSDIDKRLEKLLSLRFLHFVSA